MQLVVSAAHTPNLVGDALMLRVRPYFPVAQLHAVVTARLPLDYGSSGEVIGVLFRSIHHGARSVIRTFSAAAAKAGAVRAPKAAEEAKDYAEDDEDYAEDDEDYAEEDEDYAEEDEDYAEEDEDYAEDDEDYAEEVSVFFVVATCVPDVFELKHALKDATPIDIAGVPSLRDSQALREAAESGKAIPFQRRMRFQNKWVPVCVPEV
jgi:hypothetical protein